MEKNNILELMVESMLELEFNLKLIKLVFFLCFEVLLQKKRKSPFCISITEF